LTLLTGAISETVNKIAPLLVLYLGQATLPVTSFGSVQFAVSYIDIFLPFIAFGYGAYASIAIANPAGSALSPGRIMSTVTLLKLLHAVVIVAIALAVMMLPRYDAYRGLILSLGYLFVSSIIETDYVHSGTQSLAIRNIFSVISKLLCLGGVLILVRGPADYMYYGILSMLPNLLVALLSLRFSIKKIGWERPRTADLKPVFLGALPFGITNMLAFTLERFDVFFVEAFGGSAAVGLYVGPLRIVQSIATITAMVTSIFFSELVRIDDERRFSKHIEFSALLSMILLMPIAVGAFFVGGDLLATLFAATFANHSVMPGYVMALLSIGILATVGINTFGMQVLWLRNAMTRMNKIYAIGLISGCLLATWLGGLWGSIGVAAALAASKLTVATGCYLAARPFIPSFSWGFLARIALAAGAMAAVLFILGPDHLVWTKIMIGAVTYVCMAVLLFWRVIRDLLINGAPTKIAD